MVIQCEFAARQQPMNARQPRRLAGQGSPVFAGWIRPGWHCAAVQPGQTAPGCADGEQPPGPAGVQHASWAAVSSSQPWPPAWPSPFQLHPSTFPALAPLMCKHVGLCQNDICKSQKAQLRKELLPLQSKKRHPIELLCCCNHKVGGGSPQQDCMVLSS